MAFNSNLVSDAKIEISHDISNRPSVDQAFASFEQTYVCANGQAYTDAAILVLLKLHEQASFDIIKTQSFSTMDQVQVANKVHAATREVIEFNHQPATSAYAAALGLKSDDLAPDSFMTRQLQEKDLQLQKTTAALRQFNLVLEEEIHVRSKREEEIRHLSYHDTLTGLFNRRYYKEAMRRLDAPKIPTAMKQVICSFKKRRKACGGLVAKLIPLHAGAVTNSPCSCLILMQTTP